MSSDDSVELRLSMSPEAMRGLSEEIRRAVSVPLNAQSDDFDHVVDTALDDDAVAVVDEPAELETAVSWFLHDEFPRIRNYEN